MAESSDDESDGYSDILDYSDESVPLPEGWTPIDQTVTLRDQVETEEVVNQAFEGFLKTCDLNEGEAGMALKRQTHLKFLRSFFVFFVKKYLHF